MQVLESDDVKTGFNAATGTYEDMFAAGIIDPAKVGVMCATAVQDLPLTVGMYTRTVRSWRHRRWQHGPLFCTGPDVATTSVLHTRCHRPILHARWLGNCLLLSRKC